MSLAVEIALLAAALALLVPAGLLFAECLAALLPVRATTSVPAARPRTDVVVPARDEASLIGACLDSLRPQLAPGDRLLVVADNCRDDTAAVARREGVRVVERRDPERIGKGFALSFARRILAEDPPDVVVLVDADCVAEPGLLESLARAAAASGRPVQAEYVFEPPAAPSPTDRVSALASRMKNGIRPRGLHRLGLPCLLTGSGSAIPWSIFRDTPIGGTATAEDMRLGADLALNGHPPEYCPGPAVRARLPKTRRAAHSQRLRWEHGHLAVLLSRGPRLALEALRRRDPRLLALSLELSVPPLSLLAMAWLSVQSATLLAGGATGRWLPALACGLAGALLAGSAAIAWYGFGRALLPPGALASAPAYALGKLPLYLQFLTRRRDRWTYRERDLPSTPQPARSDAGRPGRPSVRVGPALVDAIREEECVARVLDALDEGRGGWLITLNVDYLRAMARSRSFAALCSRADLAVADGMPLVWASRLRGTPLPERVAGACLVASLAAAAAERDRSLFLVGGAPGTAAASAARLSRRHPKLRIAGVIEPQPAFERDPAAVDRIVRAVRDARPDLVYVGLGRGKQDRLIQRLRAAHPGAWYLGVGFSFSFLSGERPRAPRWMRRAGLEWLHRLTLEPTRLAGRYLRRGMPFAVGMLARAALSRARGEARDGSQ